MKIYNFMIQVCIICFDQIFPKQAFKYTIFFNIRKRQKMAKWSNHVISVNGFKKAKFS